jgi:hypothetical protein
LITVFWRVPHRFESYFKTIDYTQQAGAQFGNAQLRVY